MSDRYASLNDDELISLLGSNGSAMIQELKDRGFFKKGYPGVDRMDVISTLQGHVNECIAAMVEEIDA